MAATPKVKMTLQSADIATVLGLPENVEVLTAFITNDPFSITLILCSPDSFDELYAPDGGFEPSLSYKTVGSTFFTDQG